MKKLSLEEAERLFACDCETGALTWRAREIKCREDKIFNAQFAGKPAGHLSKEGRVEVRIGRHLIKAHRIVWLFANGEWPEAEIDHRDGNPANNAIDNLRLATSTQNKWNQKRRVDNTSGHKGVSFEKRMKRWHAYADAQGRRTTIGYFANVDDAAAARRAFVDRVHGEFVRHG